ncbi:MAG TPA: hypothetical protein PK544_13220 [Spirochaetota bacterium]|nr:hypothetical protein [Spirochaetota bacterium]HPJ40020.1 hypothetical protein [Spirochaetota bacterium]HPQ52218.1 hypothetical protein [Spirochaetota bacterium]
MSSGETGKQLADMIKHAIDDCQITTTEYEKILMLANEDGHIDSQEQRLLSNLQEMMSNGTIKRIPG